MNKKALKKQQQKASAGDGDAKAVHEAGCGLGGAKKCCDNNNSIKSPTNPTATDAASCKSPTAHDRSNSSDEDNNLSGLIMSDGLVGEALALSLITDVLVIDYAIF